MLSLCALAELGNLLNSIGPGKSYGRHRMVYARKRARELVGWMFGTYKLVDEHGEQVDGKTDVYWPYLAQIAQALFLQSTEDKSAGCAHNQI